MHVKEMNYLKVNNFKYLQYSHTGVDNILESKFFEQLYMR